MRLGWKVFWATAGGIILVQSGVVGFHSLMGREEIAQPIGFNHRKHAGELALSCTTCHQFVETQAFAGLPQTEVCMGCHAVSLTKNPEEEKIRSYARKGERIPWQRIDRMPGHVLLSHRRHAVLGGVRCATCHGKMVEQAVPLSRPLVNHTMAWCVECHELREASVDCNACHK